MIEEKELTFREKCIIAELNTIWEAKIEKIKENQYNLDKERFNMSLRNKYILVSEHKSIIKKLETKGKKDFKVLLKCIQQLNKKIKKLQHLTEFLNELLDKREDEIDKICEEETKP